MLGVVEHLEKPLCHFGVSLGQPTHPLELWEHCRVDVLRLGQFLAHFAGYVLIQAGLRAHLLTVGVPGVCVLWIQRRHRVHTWPPFGGGRHLRGCHCGIDRCIIIFLVVHLKAVVFFGLLDLR